MFTKFFLAFTSLFVALDIIGMLPMYISLTHSLKENTRRDILNRSMTVALVVALIFTIAGQKIMGALGISLQDVKIAGGIILLLISLADLVGGPASLIQASGQTGIVPLAVPLITGPAILTTLALHVNTYGYPITLISLFANYFIGWVFLKHCRWVTRMIGTDGTVVFSKIAALLLTTIAVNMIKSGIFESIKVFSHGS